MATIWVWRLYGRENAEPMLPDITGFDVEATDGGIGKVDEATYDNGEGALVVDTGFWIFGKKRMLPAGVVQGVDEDSKKVFVSCSKEEVKGAPDYDERRRNEAAYRNDVGSHYEGDPISPKPGPDLPPR
jgi:hypothetical protein